MPKAFLSHSSTDKGYVEVIVRRLSKVNIAYDSLTFEKCKLTLEEIYLELETSDIFVFFISKVSLESKWVKLELNKARELFVDGSIKQFVPIIIDETIRYDDISLPYWLKSNFNLQFINRPSKAVEIIQQKIRIVTWEIYPKNRELDQLFIGRTELIKSFEERIFNHDLNIPVAIVASGFSSIGRKKLLMRCLINTNIIRDYHQPPIIQLSNKDSIENFILNIYDLGYTKNIEKRNLLSKTVNEKLIIAKKLTEDLIRSNIILFIEDNYCIVGRKGMIASWFIALCKSFSNRRELLFCIISKNRVDYHQIINNNFIFALEVPNLNVRERKALFTAYLKIEGIDLEDEYFNIFSDLFTGIPGQVLYTVKLIKHIGVTELHRQSYLIPDFNTEFVSNIIKEYTTNKNALDLIKVLANYEFFSLNLLEKIIGIITAEFQAILSEFSLKGMIEFLGSTKEYFRLNDSIRNFVLRSYSGFPDRFKDNLLKHTKQVLKDYDQVIDRDVSDSINSIQYALLNGLEVKSDILIPSHIINTMKELYRNRGQYNTVITLADSLLEKEKFLDNWVAHEVRYWLCLALARNRDKRIFEEIRKIEGPNRNFIMGYYFRLNCQYDKALVEFNKVLSKSPNFYKAKREIIQVYIRLSMYEEVYYFAKEFYMSDKNNPYHLQSYLKCVLFRNMPYNDKEKLLLKLLRDLETIPSEKANEMYLISKAQFSAYFYKNKELAFEEIDEAINTYNKVIYPRIAKLEICSLFEDFSELQVTLDQIDRDFDSLSEIYKRYVYISAKMKLLAWKGLKEAVMMKFNDLEVRNLPKKIQEKLYFDINKYLKFK